MKAYHLKINQFFVMNESAEVINMQSFIQLEGSIKARIISKQKFKFIIDADIIETLIFVFFSAIQRRMEMKNTVLNEQKS